jgi:hypothetical protein
LSRGQIPWTSGQQGQPARHSFEQGGRSEYGCFRRDEFDGEGKTVQARDDFDNLRCLLMGKSEIGSGGGRSVKEQRHGFASRKILERLESGLVRHLQGRQRNILLAPNAERGATCHQDRHARCRL